MSTEEKEMRIQTIKSDEKGTRALVDFDAMREWIEEIEVGFASLGEDVNPFSYPEYGLRESPCKIYERATEEERRMMFSLLVGAFITNCRNGVFYKRGERELMKGFRGGLVTPFFPDDGEVIVPRSNK